MKKILLFMISCMMVLSLIIVSCGGEEGEKEKTLATASFAQSRSWRAEP